MTFGSDDHPSARDGERLGARGRAAASNDLPLLAVVVVYFRTPELLPKCLDALRGQSLPVGDLVVVDNSSVPDGRQENLEPGNGWKWLRSERNLGYGAGCNLGASVTRSRFLLFLNADVILRETACASLCAAAERDSTIGVLGPRIYDSRGNVELSARGFPTVATALAGRSSYLTRVLVAAKHTPAKLLPPPGSDKSVDWVSGACMLVRRAAFERVGGFDEGYWMYWEDADLCRRLKNAGQATVYCPEAEAWHSSGASGKSMRTIDAFHLSAARYFERHVARTPAAARVARGILRVRMTVVRRRHARRP